jgi:hypothetical protein
VLYQAAGFRPRPKDEDLSTADAYPAAAFKAGSRPKGKPAPKTQPGAVRPGRTRRQRIGVILTFSAAAAVALATAVFALSGPIGDHNPFSQDAASGAGQSAAAGAGQGGDPAHPGQNPSGGRPSGSGAPFTTPPTRPDVPPPASGTTAPGQSGGFGQTVGPTDTPDPAPTTGTPTGTTLSSDGGTVFATCTKNKVSIQQPQPADGYTVKRWEGGPSGVVTVVFDGPSQVKMKISCSNGTPNWVDGNA